MKSRHILVTAGPIPGRLDSVKLITNRFRGGLALRTAVMLAVRNQRVTVLAHEGTPIESLPEGIEVLTCKDVDDYCRVLKETPADTYVLAGAVANLVPVKPWEGKFPSHHYKEGDIIPIDFTIAPRAIDKIRTWHPEATLIGYKLYDGTDEQLIAAGKETLRGSKAHAVFCNHPKWAKERKITVMGDGAVIPMGFEEHVDYIVKISTQTWARTTKPTGVPPMIDTKELEAAREMLRKIAVNDGDLVLGTVAWRPPGQRGFWTTPRGKTNTEDFVWVEGVDHGPIVRASLKATLNAPTLANIFAEHPECRWILHGHRQLEGLSTFAYELPGTQAEARLPMLAGHAFNVRHHGFYAGFETTEAAQAFTATL